MRILAVEDEPSTWRMLAEVMKSLGTPSPSPRWQEAIGHRRPAEMTSSSPIQDAGDGCIEFHRLFGRGPEHRNTPSSSLTGVDDTTAVKNACRTTATSSCRSRSR